MSRKQKKDLYYISNYQNLRSPLLHIYAKPQETNTFPSGVPISVTILFYRNSLYGEKSIIDPSVLFSKSNSVMSPEKYICWEATSLTKSAVALTSSDNLTWRMFKMCGKIISKYLLQWSLQNNAKSETLSKNLDNIINCNYLGLKIWEIDHTNYFNITSITDYWCLVLILNLRYRKLSNYVNVLCVAQKLRKCPPSQRRQYSCKIQYK